MERTSTEKRKELERELRIAREILAQAELEKYGAPTVPDELLDIPPHLAGMGCAHYEEHIEEHIERLEEDLESIAGTDGE